MRRLLAILVLLTTALAGCGGEADAEDGAAVTVEDAWVVATAGKSESSMSSAYLVVDNATDEDVVLTGASTPVAGHAELHEVVMVDGTMTMQQVQGGITITAGRGKVFEPGGYHVMLMDLETTLSPGDEVPLTLSFSDGSTVEVSAPVKEFAEEGGHYHAPASGAPSSMGAM